MNVDTTALCKLCDDRITELSIALGYLEDIRRNGVTATESRNRLRSMASEYGNVIRINVGEILGELEQLESDDVFGSRGE